MRHATDWFAILFMLVLVAVLTALIWVTPHPVEAPRNDERLQWPGCETE